MADIEQITKIDLELSTQMATFGVKLDTIITTQDDVNAHLKTLNGKVADHERRLSDYGAFKKSVEESAQEKAKAAAQNASSIRSTIVSIAGTIATLFIIYLIYHYFHINLSNYQQ